MARPWGLDFASPGEKGARSIESGVLYCGSVLRRMVGGFIRRKTAAAIPFGEEDEANGTSI